jgi:hypothetical protein
MAARAAPREAAATPRLVLGVLVKAALLFGLLNLLLVAVDPLPALGRLTIYNWLVPGRERLPYAERPERAYSVSVYQLEAMFAAHAAARTKAPDEYRVLLVGDSATWGWLLENEDTLAGQLNRAGHTLPDGRRLRAYNLGYPILSLTKDLLLLEQAARYDADLIVWLVTLESFPADKQLFPPIVQNNPPVVRALIAEHGLSLNPADPAFVEQGVWARTLFGRRRALADWLRLQLYGVPWAATGIDQDIPAAFTPRSEDLTAEVSFHGLKPPALSRGDLAFDVLAAGLAEAGEVPVLLVNEPMFVSQGQNSDVRYNFFYPRWVYDAYRQLLADEAATRGWAYLDLWQAVAQTEFTDSPIHLTPTGSAQLAEALAPHLIDR